MVNQLLTRLQTSKPDTSRINLLTKLGQYHIYKAGEAKPDLDSAVAYLHQARLLSDSLRSVKWQHEIESLLVIISMEKKDVKQGRERFNKLIEQCRQTGDKETEARTRLRFSISLRIWDHDFSEVMDNCKQAAAIYREIKKPEKEIEVLKEIAYLHSNQGKFNLAEEELLEVLRRYKAIRYPKLHYTYHLLSNVSRLKGDLDKGLFYALQCVESMNKTQDTLSAASFYGNLAQMYQEVGKHGKSIEWYKKSLVSWRQQKLPNFSMYHTAGYIVRDLIAHKKPQEALHLIVNLVKEIPTNTTIQKACVAQNMAYCFDALNKFSQAEQQYLEALAWYNLAGNNFEASQKAQQDIGKFYLDRRQYSKAGSYLRKAVNFNPQKLPLATIKDIHFMLFQIDSAEANYLSAITHYRQHKALNDSIFNATKSRQIEELQIKYETEKKEQDIHLLSHQSKLQQTKLHQANLVKNVTFGGIAMLIIIVGLLYNQFRINKRSNEQLVGKQKEITRKNKSLQHLVNEKEWLLKEIHHRVKNNLHTIMSLLESQTTFLENDALLAVKDSQHRVHAMSLIHQKLYLSDNLKTIDMSVYLRELVSYLRDSFNVRQRIRFQLHLDPVELDVAQAIPLGLILNEAITNALKYAFPAEKKGIIFISMQKQTNGNFLLTVADNGVGLPTHFNSTNTNSLGMSLMKGLSEDINARFTIESVAGTTITIEFADNQILKFLQPANTSEQMELPV